MKSASSKTIKRLATLSAAFLVGSVATFAADVKLFVGTFGDLETVVLTGRFDDETVETLVAALPELESLSLRGTPITDAALDEIAKLERLDSLDVSYCGKTSPGKVAALRDSRSWRAFNGKEIKRTTE